METENPTTSGLPVFGSQLVDKNSSTPYSDATQVGWWLLLLLMNKDDLLWGFNRVRVCILLKSDQWIDTDVSASSVNQLLGEKVFGTFKVDVTHDGSHLLLITYSPSYRRL